MHEAHFGAHVSLMHGWRQSDVCGRKGRQGRGLRTMLCLSATFVYVQGWTDHRPWTHLRRSNCSAHNVLDVQGVNFFPLLAFGAERAGEVSLDDVAGAEIGYSCSRLCNLSASWL
jgi:hypothetical protein